MGRRPVSAFASSCYAVLLAAIFPAAASAAPGDIAAITAGAFHNCALDTGGSVKCWGFNASGQLGVEPTTDHRTPVDVPGLGSVIALSGGAAHTCAIVAGGGVKCWGSNFAGQLGDNSIVDRHSPVDVQGLTGPAAAISAGAAHTCALITDGAVRCWGYNVEGQLGTGGTDDSLTAAQVAGLGSGVAAIAAGYDHTCAVMDDATLRCWGYNAKGQLGDGGFTRRTTPYAVAGLAAGVTAVAAGEMHTCAIMRGGALKCWGWNVAGQLGNNSLDDAYVPVDVATLSSGVLAVALGETHTCAIVADAGVRCWGANSDGQVGDGTNSIRPQPTAVIGLASGAVRIEAGSRHTCVLVSSDGVRCWGYNPNGQLGDDSNTLRRAPVPVVGLVGSDATPDAFTFLQESGVPVSSVRTSSFVIPVGYVVPSPISVSNGEYSIGCTAAFTSLVGSILPGEGLCVRHVSAPVPATPVTTTVVIGGMAATFVTTTGGAPPADVVTFAPGPLEFGGQSLATTSLARTVTITNATGAPLTLASVAVSAEFEVTHDCATLAADAACTAHVTFIPPVAGQIGGALTVSFAGGTRSLGLAGTGEATLTTHYYHAILRREPDAGGKAFWNAEAARMQALGVNLNETWFAMAAAFFTSAEYGALARDDAGFTTDLYTTFFDRTPDAGGQAFWVSLLQQGLPREVMLAAFVFSPEFTGFTQAIFGNTAARAEVDMVVDFYRGLLARLPDDSGFAFWAGRFRAAQCSGPAAVIAQVEAISSQFATGTEYAARARNHSQYVGDLYNAFLRRGGDLAGVQFWIAQLAGGQSTREQVRGAFVASPEFQARVLAVIAAGCQP